MTVGHSDRLQGQEGFLQPRGEGPFGLFLVRPSFDCLIDAVQSVHRTSV